MQTAFLAPLPALSPLHSPCRKPNRTPLATCKASASNAPLRHAARLAALALAISPLPSHARTPKITMTDQVPNFTLPSQEQSQPPLLTRAIAVGQKVVPVALVAGGAVILVRRGAKRAERKQLRDFQAQLESLSSMLETDVGNKREEEKGKKRGTEKKFKFRTEGEKKKEEGLEEKVQLEIFQKAKGGKDTSIESVAREALNAAVEGKVEEGRRKMEGKGVGKGVIEKIVSEAAFGKLKRAASLLESDDRESLKQLQDAVRIVSAGKQVFGEVKLGKWEAEQAVREELYRRFAVFCLSQGGETEVLEVMREVLGIGAERSEALNAEVAKGVFQVAVSAAMAEGKLDEEGKKALEELKNNFGTMLDGSADEIMSEVAVMRAMYSLQQLLQEQGVSREEVEELKKMCKELGVDLDEMLANADALGEALGKEAREFVQSLKRLLADDGVVTTTSKAVDPE